ncbi:MAG: hypothetical protein ACSLEX_02875 [Minisyncoccota bacterium]
MATSQLDDFSCAFKNQEGYPDFENDEDREWEWLENHGNPYALNTDGGFKVSDIFEKDQ